MPNGANFVDLHVYVGGAATIGTRRPLYDYVYADQTPDFPLPFTYPPFAGRGVLPAALRAVRRSLAFAWQVGIVAALYGVVWFSLRLLGRAGSRAWRWRWTAVGIWIEPVRSTLRLRPDQRRCWCSRCCTPCYSSRWWLSGLLVGLAAGVKLTPAVAGLYFVGARRWRRRGVLGRGVRRHRRRVGAGARRSGAVLLHRPARRRRAGSARSARRSTSPGAAASPASSATTPGTGRRCSSRRGVTAVLAVAGVARASAPTIGSGAIVVVQLFGLLLSPIRWTHHWVWLMPLMIWLLHGPLGDRRGARMLGWGWLVADPGRRAVAAELRAADHLGDRAALVPGLGGPDLHRGDAGDPGLDRR